MEELNGKEYKKELFSYFGVSDEDERYLPMFQSLDKIVSDTKGFYWTLLEKMKQGNHIFKNDIFINYPIGDIDFVINGKVGAGIFDTLVQLELGQNVWISERLLKQFMKGFLIEDQCNIEEAFEPIDIEEIGSITPCLKLFVSGPVQKFEELYDGIFKQIHKQKVLK